MNCISLYGASFIWDGKVVSRISDGGGAAADGSVQSPGIGGGAAADGSLQSPVSCRS